LGVNIPCAERIEVTSNAHSCRADGTDRKGKTMRAQKLTIAALALAAGLSLTACQGDKDSDASKNTSGSSANESKEKSGGSEGQSSGSNAEAQAGNKAGAGKRGKGVSGTWFGTVKYMAPGKYTVSDMKGVEQQFFTSKTTNIQGAGDICGDEDGQAATKCTESQLAAAAKKGVSAKVQIKKGIAVSIIDDHSGSGNSGGGNSGGGNSGGGHSGGGKGVSGTWFGTVKYMAPGKYTVSDMKGVEQQFFTSTTTNIQGAGDICGDEDGQAATKCTESQLAAAAKKGVSAKVQVKDGIAVSIIDDH
jgi:hypothetical protein